MADIELAAAIVNATGVAGSVLAARFLESEISYASTVQADASVSGGDLSAAIVSGSSVSANPTSAPELSGTTSPLPIVTGSLVRSREIASSAEGLASVLAAINLRQGIQAGISSGASINALLGDNIPLAAAITSAASVSAESETGGTVLQDLYMQVTGAPVFNNDADVVQGTPGTWTLPVTLRRGGTAGTLVPKGAAVVKWGQYSATPSTDFTGGIILTSDLDNAPYMDVFTVFKNNAGVLPWDDAALKPRVRMGNLRGVLGNSTDKWGIAMSTDLTNASAPYIEASNAGLVLNDVDLSIINGEFYVGDAGHSTYLEWDGSSLSIAGDGSGFTNIDGGNIQTGTIGLDKLITGTDLPFAANPLFYLPFNGQKPYETNFTGSAISHKGDRPTITGGVIYRRGKFGKAVQVAEATTNIVVNPSAEVNVTTGVSINAPNPSTLTLTRDTTNALYGSASFKGVYTFVSGNAEIFINSVGGARLPATAGQPYTVSFNVFIESYSAGASLIFGGTFFDSGGNVLPGGMGVSNVIAADKVGKWVRYSSSTAAAPAGAASILIAFRSSLANHTFYLDGIQYEQKAYLTPYCDGSLGVGHSWSGTEHASSSSRTAAILSYPQMGNITHTTGTVMAWVYVEGLSTTSNTEVFRVDGASSTFIILRVENTLGRVFGYWGTASQYASWSSGLTTGVWHHLALTYDGSITRLFVDGAQVGSRTGASSFVPAPTNRMGVGGHVSGTTPINGMVDDFAILDVALSPDQVAAVYNSNNSLAVGQGNYDLLLTGGESGGWIQGNGDGLVGYDSAGERQAWFGSDGKFYAGAGAVTLDSDGVSIDAAVSVYAPNNSIKFWGEPSYISAEIWGVRLDDTNGDRLFIKAGSSTEPVMSDTMVEISSRARMMEAHLTLVADGAETNVPGYSPTMIKMENNTLSGVGIDTIFLDAEEVKIQRSVGEDLNAATLRIDGSITLHGRAAPTAPASGRGALYWSTTNWPIALNSAGLSIPLSTYEVNMPVGGWYLSGGSSYGLTNYAAFMGFGDGALSFADSSFVLPKGWGGKSLSCEFLWYAAGASGAVVWTVEIRSLADEGSVPSTPTATASITEDPGTVLEKSTVSLGTTGMTEGRTISVRIFRNGTHASDTRAATAYIGAVRFYII